MSNQFFAAITCGEARDIPGAMLADSAYQVIGHADVKNGAMFVGHDIDPEIVPARHGAIFSVFMRVGETYSLSVMSSVSRDISSLF